MRLSAAGKRGGEGGRRRISSSLLPPPPRNHKSSSFHPSLHLGTSLKSVLSPPLTAPPPPPPFFPRNPPQIKTRSPTEEKKLFSPPPAWGEREGCRVEEAPKNQATRIGREGGVRLCREGRGGGGGGNSDFGSPPPSSSSSSSSSFAVAASHQRHHYIGWRQTTDRHLALCFVFSNGPRKVFSRFSSRLQYQDSFAHGGKSNISAKVALCTTPLPWANFGLESFGASSSSSSSSSQLCLPPPSPRRRRRRCLSELR